MQIEGNIPLSLNNRFLRGRPSFAFTLIEVVIAMGIFAFAIVAILALMPQMMSQSKESWQETRAANIARQIANDLTSGQDEAGYLITNSAPDGLPLTKIDLTTKGTYEATYDIEGIPATAASKDIGFRAKLMVEPDSARAGLSNVIIQVKQANAPAGAEEYDFYTKVAALSMKNQATP